AVNFRNENVAVRSHEHIVRLVEVIGIGGAARFTERHQHLSVFIKLENLVTLRRACGCTHRSCRTTRGAGRRLSSASGTGRTASAGSASGAGCSARCAGSTTPLVRTVIIAVSHPDVVVSVDEQAVWKHDNACAKAFDQLSVLVEVQYRIELRHLSRGGV